MSVWLKRFLFGCLLVGQAKAQDIPDVDKLTAGFQQLKNEFDALTGLADLDDPIPFVGKSLNQILTNGGDFVDNFDFTGFAADFGGGGGSLSAVRDAIVDYIEGQITDLTLGANANSYCGGSNSAEITKSGDIATISFCSKYTYSGRTTSLTGGDLLEDEYDYASLELSSTVGVSASVVFGAQLKINVTDGNVEELKIGEASASLTVDATADLSFKFSFIEMSANDVDADASVAFAIEYCTSGCGGLGVQVGSSNFYIDVTGNYKLEGTLELAASYPGVNIGGSTSSSFEMVEDDIFDFSPTITGFDLSDFVEGFDIDNLLTAFNKLLGNFADFTDLRNLDVFYQPIPIVGQSVGQLLLGGSVTDSFDKVVDFVEFISDTKSKPNGNGGDLNLATVRSEFLNYLESVHTTAGLGDGCATGDYAVSVSLDVNVVTLEVCSLMAFDRQIELTGKDLFKSSVDAIEVDIDFDLDFEVSLELGFTLTVPLDDPVGNTAVVLKPLVAELAFEATPKVTLALGTLEVTSDAYANASASFQIEYCDSAPCPDEQYQLGTDPKTDLYMQRSLEYYLEGGLSLDMTLLGFELDNAARFNLSDDDAFDDQLPVLHVDTLDFDDFLSLTPVSCIAFMRLIDSALVRAQELEVMKTNIPFTNTTFASILSTGSFLIQKLLKLFLKPTPFADRAQKSLRLVADKPIAEMLNDGVKGGDLTSTTLRLLKFHADEKELDINPDDYTEIAKESAAKTCDLVLNTVLSEVDKDQEFAALLRTRITACGWKVGGPGDCDQDDDGDFYNCDKDVVVDVDSDGLVFIASVAYEGSLTGGKDLHLLGLYNASNPAGGETSVLGFPLNSPAFPALIPRFRNFENFTDLLNEAMDDLVEGLDIEFKYVPAAGQDFSRFEVSVEYERHLDFGVSFDGSIGIGDLIDISVDPGDAGLDLKLDVYFNTNFGAVLGPNSIDVIRVLGEACGGNENQSYSCDGNPLTIQLDYKEGNTDKSTTINVPARGEENNATDVLQDAFGSVATIQPQPPTLIVIKFDKDVGSIDLKVPKICIDPDDNEAERLVCLKGEKATEIPNSYGLTDQEYGKTPFQIAVGDTNVSASIEVKGWVTIFCTILGVIDVSASMSADFKGGIDVFLGNGKFNRFTEWLGGLTAVLNSESEGYIDNFLTATATVNGSFSGIVSVGPPFNSFVDPVGVSGYFVNPYVLDFLDIDGSGLPDVKMDVDIPEIGDITKISFENVVDLLVKAMNMLVGENRDDGSENLEDCNGGLLGTSDVFQKQIPVLGFSICSFAERLQVIIDAVDELLDETTEANGTTTTTFNTLDSKLTNLLKDGVGGEPSVDLATQSNDIRSELTLEIVLHWSFSEFLQIFVDMAYLLTAEDTSGGIGYFAKKLVAAEGEASVNIDAGVTFTLGVGLEYNSQDQELNTYFLGTTGLEVTLGVDADASFEIQAGPLSGMLDADFEVHKKGDKTKPMSLVVGLDPGKNYTLGQPTSTRPNFEVVGTVTELIEKINFVFDGAIDASFAGSLDLIGISALIDLEVTDIDDLLRNSNFGVIDVDPPTITGPRIQPPSLLEILLQDPQGLLDTLNSAMKSLEDATLGPRGIVTLLTTTFIRKAVPKSLGAGTPDNIIGRGRRRVVSTLQEGLDKLEGQADTVAELLGVLVNLAVKSIGILRPGHEVQTKCYHYDKDASPPILREELDECSSKDPKPDSVMWSIPFGQKFVIEIPLDFDLDTGGFPLEMEMNGDENAVPTLEIGWSFLLAFGFDDEDGFFIYTHPEDGAADEFEVYALLEILDRGLSATLIMLKAKITDLDLVVGAKIFVDFDKSKALGKPDLETDRGYGRLALGDLKSIKITNLFTIGSVAGAALSIQELSFGLNTDILPDSVAKWIPKLTAQIGFQARRRDELSFRRRLELSAKGESSSPGGWDIELHSEHRAFPMLRSLERDDSILNDPFEFDACPLTGGKIFCGNVSNIKLDMVEITKMLSPIIGKFIAVNTEDPKGFLESVVDPQLLVLNKRLPGISDIMKKKVTVLDIAEAFLGAKSGAPTVRKIIEIYEKVKAFLTSFLQDQGITIADECDIFNGFKCTGGVFDLFKRRRLQNSALPFFDHQDSSGLPITPVEIVKEARILADDCPSSFSKPSCSGSCSGCPNLFEKSKCNARYVACRSGSVTGLTFPFMQDLKSVVNLLIGKDIDIVRFVPPDVIFAFEYRLSFIIYSPPVVEVVISFEFTVRLKVGFNFDTKGIREAIEQKSVLKALNSFALMDTFDGVDEAMITMTASVTLAVEVSAVIVKVGVSGTITFRVTIDLFDPYPETSRGLIRPFELLSVGSSPLEWFEFGLEIFITIKIYIKIGLFLGFVEITLFKYEKSWQFNIIDPLIWKPKQPTPPAFLGNDGVLSIANAAASIAGVPAIAAGATFECTSQGGSINDETIECKKGDKAFVTFEGVKNLDAGSSGSDSILLKGIKSPVNLGDYGGATITLDYRTAGADVVANDEITILEKEVLVGYFQMTFEQIGKGVILLPKPEQEFLTTYVGGECNNPWILDGHTNIYVKAYGIKQNCALTCTGGNATNALLTVDFGFRDRQPCDAAGTNRVTMRTTPEGNVEVIIFRAPSITLTLTLPETFTDFIILMSTCKDEVLLENTLNSNGSVSIFTGGENDVVTIGTDDDGVDEIYKNILVDGGSQLDDQFIINDSGSNKVKTEGWLTSAAVLGLLNGFNTSIEYAGIEDLDIKLSKKSNTFQVVSTAPIAHTSILAQGEVDTIFVNETQGDLLVQAGDGDDLLYFYGLGDGTEAVVHGDVGADTIWIDGTENFADNPAVNILEGSTLRWNGGEGDDTMHVKLGFTGIFNIDLFGDMDGVNDVNIDCGDTDTVMLSRENFLANIHNLSDVNSTYERLNLESSATINTIAIRLNEGSNEMVFDDTFASMHVYGGSSGDVFRIGQLYNSERNALQNVVLDDPIETTLTSKGFLSNGISHPVTINGVGGNDVFDVLRNRETLVLYGDSDQDAFTIRSHATCTYNARPPPSRGVLDYYGARVADGADPFDFEDNHGRNPFDFPLNHSAKLEDPDYIVNSLVSVHGGTHTDDLQVIGTECDDSYVVTTDSVLGGGLTVSYMRVESLEVSTEEGNDVITETSSSPEATTYIYGSNDTDRFVVAPRIIEPIVSKNLGGHRGVLEHAISSQGSDYNGIYLRGIAVDVLDNEGGFVKVHETEAIHLMSEDELGSFSFFVYPTSVPVGKLVVSIVSPTDGEGNRYLTLNGSDGPAIELEFAATKAPQEVLVAYNKKAEKLSVTDSDLLINVNVMFSETTDPKFLLARQSVSPVRIKLLPSVTRATAKSVTVVEPTGTGKTVVAEGNNGFQATYHVYLRPCDSAMRANTIMRIIPSVANQVTVVPSEVTGGDWNEVEDCRVPITVTADESFGTGLHFVTLRHEVKTTPGNDDIQLSDQSILTASEVLVEVHDDDTPGVIITESMGETSVAEFDGGTIETEYYQDSYTIRLSSEPSENVTVTVHAKPLASERGGSEEVQAGVGATAATANQESQDFTFSKLDWFQPRTVHVAAKDDGSAEGVDWLNFNPQPSYLSYLQGPVILSSTDNALSDPVAEPLMMYMSFGETDTDDLTDPPGDPGVIDRGIPEEELMENMEVYNLDVRGTTTSYSVLTQDFVSGLNMAAGIRFEGMDVVELRLGDGADNCRVESVVEATQLLVRTRGEADWLYVNGLAKNAIANIYGGYGDDTMSIDGTNNFAQPAINKFTDSRVRWSGGFDDDTTHIKLSTLGLTNMDLFNDLNGTNDLNIDCADEGAVMLSRENFLANIHNKSDPTSTVERVNLIRERNLAKISGWEDTASINTIIIRLNEGNNEMHFDDTIGPMDVFGGSIRDEYHIGQMYNSSRDRMANVNVNDPIETVNTTRGYLSNGNSHPITLNGEYGDDFFDVLRNKQLLDLNGGSGDDVFVIRSFVYLDVMENGTEINPNLGKLELKGDNGTDTFDFKKVDPDYVVNSLVDVDGGTGDDKMIIVGTEFDDSYVVQDGMIFGGGLSVAYTNIETLELTTEEGNDLVTVLSTNPNLVTYLYGSKGSDRFVVTPRTVAPVSSKNLRGHRGILEHSLTSDDPEYDGLLTEGVAVNMLDDDGEYGGYVNIYETEPVHLMSEDGFGDFSFWVYPTSRPNGTLTVNIVPQADRNGTRFVMLNQEFVPAKELYFTDMTPQQVNVSYYPGAARLRISDENLLIKNNIIYSETDDDRFERAFQTVLPIAIKLIPEMDSAEAMSVTVVEPKGETVVVEGDPGGFATYDVYLRPCNATMRSNTVLRIKPTVENQVTLSQDYFNGDDWIGDGECKVTVTVTPEEDSLQEGTHFTTLRHIVSNLDNNDIILSDGFPLYAENVLVRIHDDELSGIIITESVGITATAEVNETRAAEDGLTPNFYKDTYTIRLSKQPASNVTVLVNSIPVATDRDTPSTSHLNRSYEERIQALLGYTEENTTEESIELVFTPSNWSEEQVVHVAARDDDIEEGADWLSFPSQPSYLSYIQGPIIISGALSADYPDIGPPVMLPGENDTSEFIIPENAVYDDSFRFINEADQVDYLQIYNLDVRGNMPSIGFLTDTQLTGFNMAADITVVGVPQPDGITYTGMEVIEIFLGDGVDDLTVINTTEAMHVIDLGGGNDIARVKTIDGPFIFHGGMGNDTVTVTSDETKLDKIHALFGFDGGEGDSDRLILDNTADPAFDEVLNVTKTMVEVKTMDLSPDRQVIPESSYLVKLRGATGGQFQLELDDPTRKYRDGPYNVTIDWPVNLTIMESRIQRGLIPKENETDSCGDLNTSQCTNAVKVWPIGDTYAIFFVGERLNETVTLKLYTDDLDFTPEMFQNETNDYLLRNSDVAYANLEFLDIFMGDHDIVSNVRGTTAVTTITTQTGDDTFFVSSEANQNTANAGSVDFLHGWLDYFEEDLYLIAQSGRHRLMISDESSYIPKGYDEVGGLAYGPAVLTNASLTDIHPRVGDVFFTAKGGHWSDGVNLWLGISGDRLDVHSVPSNPDAAPLRTATSVHCGNGSDIVNVMLALEDHDGVVFVANGQYGDDLINASRSSLPVILFGDGDDDTLVGGSGNDVLIGDYGRVLWRSSNVFSNPDGVIEAMAGQGGYGDFTDGVIREITDVYAVSTNLGGNDKLVMGGGDDVGIGGAFHDVLEGQDGRDIVFGDSAYVTFHINTIVPKQAVTINCGDGGNDVLYGGFGPVDYLVGGSFNDTIYGDTARFDIEGGMDLAFGDHARIEFYDPSQTTHKLRYATTTDTGCTGGDDHIYLGAGDDIAFGGAANDWIEGDGGQDIILGDFGYYDPEVAFLPYQYYVSDIHHYNDSGDDDLYGGDDDDFIMGQEGNDYVDGGAGRDDIYGGHTIRTGKDADDILLGGPGSDAILGDNGEIIRNRIDYTSSYPWINGMVWEVYPNHFSDEVIRDIRRYDDIDYVQGDDTIYGGQGNDILHGQRGDDFIFGGEGEDEVYGELGSDTLDGGEGNDIVLGDIGYAVRRFEASGDELLQDEARGTDSLKVWHKDVVLEDLGNITGMDRISTKLKVDEVTAEDIMSSSLLFVATAIKEDGTKLVSANNGGWLTELIRFKLVDADDDTINGGDGDDVLIGQRGNDVIRSGDGNNLVIGDAGWNTIPINMDMPRIHQVYRALADTSRSDLVVAGASDFGVVFTADYEIFPGQYENTDILSTIIDTVINVDDVERDSNLMRDKLGVSSLTTTRNYCMQPMFRVTPGFLHKTQWLHGNDRIQTGSGENIVVGDDIHGATALDLTEISNIQSVRQRLDGLVKTIGRRMSTVEVDTEFFRDDPQMSYNISVGGDTILTDIEGESFVSGDTLTILARSVLPGSLVGNGLFVSTALIDGILQRMFDVEQVLMNLDFALFEIHTELLGRMQDVVIPDQKPTQVSLHHLYLANDEISSHGNNDLVVGDSSLLYLHADRPGRAGFEFDSLGRFQAFRVRLRLRRLVRSRERDMDRHVRLDLKKSSSISRDDAVAAPWADVPFKLTVATDSIDLNDGENLAVGDFCTVGTVLSARLVPDELDRMQPLMESFQNVRRPPSLVQDPQELLRHVLPLYSQRYSASVATTAKPAKHGDYLQGRSRANAAAGEFVTSFTYQTFAEGEARFSVGDDYNAFEIVASDEFDGDTFKFPLGASVDGQLGIDKYVDALLPPDADLTSAINKEMEAFFFRHRLVSQMKNDVWYERIRERDLKGIKAGFQCVDVRRSSYIPSASFDDIDGNTREYLRYGVDE